MQIQGERLGINTSLIKQIFGDEAERVISVKAKIKISQAKTFYSQKVKQKDVYLVYIGQTLWYMI